MKDKISQERLEKLHPKLKQTFKSFIEECENTLNIVLRIVQGLRTFEEQNAIYNQPHDGKDNDGDGKIDEADEHVSNSRGGTSYHNYGFAVDIIPIVNGKPNWNYDFKNIVPIATKYGLYWGGNFKDYDHFEYNKIHWKQLLEKYTKKDYIVGTTYVNI